MAKTIKKSSATAAILQLKAQPPSAGTASFSCTSHMLGTAKRAEASIPSTSHSDPGLHMEKAQLHLLHLLLLDHLRFNFRCEDCQFNLDAKCTAWYLNIKYKDGGHLFFLVEPDLLVHYLCDVCKDFGRDTHLIQCMVPACPRHFHFHCAPFTFPEKIKSKCHFHSLTFAKTWVEDDFGNVCKEVRNPKHPAYHCTECDFIAHVSCTVWEVLPTIIAEYENDAEIRWDLTNDATLQKLDRRIYDVRAEEEKSAKEIEKITSKLKAVTDTRARYVASRNQTTLPEMRVMQTQ